MADASIPVQTPDVIDNRLDAESVVVGGTTVLRERIQIAGDGAAELAAVQNTVPAGTEYGLIVRPISDEDTGTAVTNYLTSASLAAGASVNLDGTTIPAAKTGRLTKVIVGSSVACKWEIKTRDGAVEVTRGMLFTQALASNDWVPPSADHVTLAGAGVDENFRITATNLDDNLAADVYVTIFSREV